MSNSCAGPGQEPAPSGHGLGMSYLPGRLCRNIVHVSVALQRKRHAGPCGRRQSFTVLDEFLYVGSRNLLGLATGGPLLWCCSVPFDLATTSLGADFFK